MAGKIEILTVLLVIVGTSFCGYLSPPFGFTRSLQALSSKPFFYPFGQPVHTYTGYNPYHSHGLPPHLHSQSPPQSPYHPLHSLHSLHAYPNRQFPECPP